MMTFADKVIRFNKQLTYTGLPLPAGIRILDPFNESGQAMEILKTFCHSYFNDTKARRLILGINPGRFGTGVTGIPFTDPKRLISECHIPYNGKLTHETSSVFVYDMIKAYGGVKKFYSDFFINSVCPLGFTLSTAGGKEKNYNYYDSKELMQAVNGFIIDNIHNLIALGVKTDVCFCFGTGANEKFLTRLNDEHRFFKKIVALEHPRFIMQYKSREKEFYIKKYLFAFKANV